MLASAIVPVAVIGPPVKPVPVATFVTVPVPSVVLGNVTAPVVRLMRMASLNVEPLALTLK